MNDQGSNSWDNAGGGVENKEGDLDLQYTNGVWGNTDDQTWDANFEDSGPGRYDDYQGGEDTFNNVPAGQEGDQYNNVVPSGNALDNNAGAAPSPNAVDDIDWDPFEDDDGFPPGLFIALLALLLFLVYRKSTQSNHQQQANCTTRGGYQPVRAGDHSKSW